MSSRTSQLSTNLIRVSHVITDRMGQQEARDLQVLSEQSVWYVDLVYREVRNRDGLSLIVSDCVSFTCIGQNHSVQNCIRVSNSICENLEGHVLAVFAIQMQEEVFYRSLDADVEAEEGVFEVLAPSEVGLEALDARVDYLKLLNCRCSVKESQ